MPTQAKAAVIDEITERFQSSNAAGLTEYRGLTVAQLTQLRRSLGEGSSYAVVKNTLTKRAADAVGVFEDLGARVEAVDPGFGQHPQAVLLAGRLDDPRQHQLPEHLVAAGGLVQPELVIAGAQRIPQRRHL